MGQPQKLFAENCRRGLTGVAPGNNPQPNLGEEGFRNPVILLVVLPSQKKKLVTARLVWAQTIRALELTND